MESRRRIRVLLGVVTPFLVVSIFIYAIYHCRRKQRWLEKRRKRELSREREYYAGGESEEAEDLIIFPSGENVTVHDILDAPGEVIGKSCHGTLYKARLQRSGGGGGGGGGWMLLRFVHPACIGRVKEIFPAVQLLGFVRHPNLVPLQAMYVGPREEKLLVHPFFTYGNLLQFLRGGSTEYCKWEMISKLSIGIAQGLDHLHNGLLKPIVHGNLKSKNILLDASFHPCLSDYGLHLLLNPTAGQEMLEVSAAQGYRALELIKMRDASKESDIYSLGVIFLEMIPRKEPMSSSKLSSSWDLHLQSPIKDLNLISEIFNFKNQNFATEEVLVAYFQLAKACCSPSPSLRPDIKHVITRLQEIGN